MDKHLYSGLSQGYQAASAPPYLYDHEMTACTMGIGSKKSPPVKRDGIAQCRTDRCPMQAARASHLNILSSMSASVVLISSLSVRREIAIAKLPKVSDC